MRMNAHNQQGTFYEGPTVHLNKRGVNRLARYYLDLSKNDQRDWHSTENIDIGSAVKY